MKSFHVISDDIVVKNLITETIAKKCPATQDEKSAELKIELIVDRVLALEQYELEQKSNEITIRGGSRRALIYGAGKLLHSCKFGEESFEVPNIAGGSLPDKPFRGIYLANHFFNWYHVASEEEIETYLGELALWGCNALILVFPIINIYNWEDPEAANAFKRISMFVSLAHKFEMLTGIGVVPNQDFKIPDKRFTAEPNSDELGRRGDNGNNICQYKDGAMEYIRDIAEKTAEGLKHTKVDAVIFWPYDEGGCGCDKCAPWGAKGYIKLSKFWSNILKAQMPDLKIFLSTWAFDTPPCGEYEGFYNELKKEPSWVDYVVCDSHESYPEYPLQHELPDGIPLINYPEISMWGLFPWGGFGANPLPLRLESLWNEVKHNIHGGYPYSEGPYDDINKVLVSGFYWDMNATADQILDTYISYEYGTEALEEIKEMIYLIEKSHDLFAKTETICFDDVRRAYELAKAADMKLTERQKKAWRWRILYIRAVLDYERYTGFAAKRLSGQRSWGEALKGSDTAEQLMTELISIYHSFEKDDGTYPEHSWIRPPLS